MPDRRKHRGPHPQDRDLFHPDRLAVLRVATTELCWLLSRGYKDTAAVRLVGDHHQLHARQRKALLRCAATDDQVRGRAGSLRPVEGAHVVVDGFNVLVTLEAALSGGLLLLARDGRTRDLASVHGNYRTVDETDRAVDLAVEALRPAASVRWLLDEPVSNSGRLAARLRARGATVTLTSTADGDLRRAAADGAAVATADGPVLDDCDASVDVVAVAMESLGPVWRVSL